MRKSLKLIFLLPCVLFMLIMLNGMHGMTQVSREWVIEETNPDGISIFDDIGWSALYPVDMAVGPDGYTYVTGNTSSYWGRKYVFTAKYSPTGLRMWVRYYSGVLYDFETHSFEATAITLDAGGNAFVTGIATINETQVKSLFVVKYPSTDPNNRKIYSGAGLLPIEIAIDNVTGSIYVSVKKSTSSEYQLLKFDEELSGGFFRGGLNRFVMCSDNSGNLFISELEKEIGEPNFNIRTTKYNSNFVPQWDHLYDRNGNGNDEPFQISPDGLGNVFVAGISSIESNQDFLLLKYNTVGELEWSRFHDISPLENLTAMAIDLAGNAYLTGQVLINSNWDWSIVKYNSVGEKVIESVLDSGEPLDNPTDIAFDASGNTYVTGNFGSRNFHLVKFNDAGSIVWIETYGSANFDLAKRVGTDDAGNVYITGDWNVDQKAVTIKYVQCNISCPENIIVNNDAGECGAFVSFPESQGSAVCGTLNYSHASGDFFTVGSTVVTVYSETGEEYCTFTITVNDKELPVITTCPAGLTVSCASEVPEPDISLIEATDNCTSVTISHVGDVKSNETCANRFTLTRTYSATDGNGNVAVCTQIITVYDGSTPVISGLTASPSTLWPPNHKMKDILLNYTVTDNCYVKPVAVSIKSNEPDNGTSDGDTDQDFLVTDNFNVKLRAERSANGDGRIYEIKVTADDGCNDPVIVTTQVVVAHNIKSPVTGASYKIGSTVNLEGVFWDKPGNTHTASWMIDNTTVKGIVTEPAGLKNGKVTGSYKFSTAGVYKLQMNVKDQEGVTSYANTNGDVDAIVVIYDPNGGNAYGGGWFASPKGALKADPDATGKVSFGFASSYFKKATSPKGETQMEFKIGSLEFNALNFEYLVINNARAQFKGTGKINGDKAGYGFIMTIIDGKIGGSGTDKIRLKIYNKNTGEVIYDNQPGASDADDPQTTVGDGSDIVIITATKQGIKEDLEFITEANGTFGIKLFPNPTQSSFNLLVSSLDKTDVQVKVFNSTGQLVKSMKSVAGQTTSFGNELKAGMYFIEVVQGVNKRTVKLIKF